MTRCSLEVVNVFKAALRRKTVPTSNGKEQYGGEVSLSSSTDPDGMAGSGKIGNRSLSDGRATDDDEGVILELELILGGIVGLGDNDGPSIHTEVRPVSQGLVPDGALISHEPDIGISARQSRVLLSNDSMEGDGPGKRNTTGKKWRKLAHSTSQQQVSEISSGVKRSRDSTQVIGGKVTQDIAEPDGKGTILAPDNNDRSMLELPKAWEPKGILFLQFLRKSEDPPLVFLIETKSESKAMEFLGCKLGMAGGFFVKGKVYWGHWLCFGDVSCMSL
ncbi:hypothetical protein Acr_19g0007240 [Actinidia rufa]|uniref:Uncharacterized protein n=1 Tax=Actinidia rufa TaxID=165716 RepID=A0A7J0GAF7_9ERIC|nr:hypothetical protein Acr_19g0007240 [Actinidia rufa]